MWSERQKGEGFVEMLLLAFSPLEKTVLCVCPPLCGSPLWQRPQKLPFISPEHLALLRKDPERRQPSHAPGWHGFSLVNTSVLHPWCIWLNLHQNEGLLPQTSLEKRRSSTSVLYICISLVRITMHHLTRRKESIFSQAWETHPINEVFFTPLGFFRMPQRAVCTKHNLSTRRQTGTLFFSIILTHQFLFTLCYRQ